MNFNFVIVNVNFVIWLEFDKIELENQLLLPKTQSACEAHAKRA